MQAASLDLLKRHADGSSTWIDAVHDIQTARSRLEQLCAASPGDYFVFDQNSQQIVVQLSTPEGV
jgi:hypothetical protein